MPYQSKIGRFKAGLLSFVAILALAGCGSQNTSSVIGGVAGSEVPSAEELREAGPLGEKTLGNPDAPVVLIEYASLGCPLCAHFHKSVYSKFKSAYVDTGKVYFIYREFPIGASPTAAAQAARCVEDRHFFPVNEKFFARRSQWNARNADNDLLYKIVQDTGISRDAFDSCMANQEIQDGINWVKLRGRKLGVKGTPTFFINDDKIRGAVTFETLSKIIDKHLARTANPA